MEKAMPEDKIAAAMAQAAAQFESIKEMVGNLRAGQENDNASQIEEAEQRIQEDALSVEVRSDWYVPGSREKPADDTPAEYRILLCTGGPACQMIGDLDEHCQPISARIECQDWFTPWTEWRGEGWDEEIALEYARCFWFGE